MGYRRGTGGRVVHGICDALALNQGLSENIFKSGDMGLAAHCHSARNNIAEKRRRRRMWSIYIFRDLSSL